MKDKNFESMVSKEQKRIDFIRNVMETSFIAEGDCIDEYYEIAVQDAVVKVLLELTEESVECIVNNIIEHEKVSTEVMKAYLRGIQSILGHTSFSLHNTGSLINVLKNFYDKSKYTEYTEADKVILSFLDEDIHHDIKPGVFLREFIYYLESITNSIDMQRDEICNVPLAIGSHECTTIFNGKEIFIVVTEGIPFLELE